MAYLNDPNELLRQAQADKSEAEAKALADEATGRTKDAEGKQMIIEFCQKLKELGVPITDAYYLSVTTGASSEYPRNELGCVTISGEFYKSGGRLDNVPDERFVSIYSLTSPREMRSYDLNEEMKRIAGLIANGRWDLIRERCRGRPTCKYPPRL